MQAMRREETPNSCSPLRQPLDQPIHHLGIADAVRGEVVRVEEDLGVADIAGPVQILDAFEADAAEIQRVRHRQRAEAQEVEEIVEGLEAVHLGGRLRQPQLVDEGQLVQRLRPDGAGDVEVELDLGNGVEIVREGQAGHHRRSMFHRNIAGPGSTPVRLARQALAAVNWPSGM